MKTIEFINQVLIQEIGDIKSRHPFLAFNLIYSGIEFLGKCMQFDNLEDFDGRDIYFKGALRELFPPSYKPLINEMWSNLRNGMIHLLRPKSGIGLSELKHDKWAKIHVTNHPYKQDDKYVLIVEYFYSDFVEACREIMRRKPNLMEKKILNIPNQ